MKRKLVLIVFMALISCNADDQMDQSEVAEIFDEPVLVNEILEFKTEESFLGLYSNLSTFDTDELNKWISDKKLIALLNITSDSLEMQEDVISKSRVIYSDALKSILNYDSKVKIGNNTLWLNERSFYLLPRNLQNKRSKDLIAIQDDLQVYGQLLGSIKRDDNSTSRNTFPNENRSKTFVTELEGEQGSRLRHVLDLFNETIVINDVIKSSKMYLRSTLQYRSCSTWRCTWKDASDLRSFQAINLFCNVCQNSDVFSPWKLEIPISAVGLSGTQTFLLANWTLSNVLVERFPNFAVSGSVSGGANGGWFTTNIEWY